MGSDVVYLSAPCDLRGAGQAELAWEALRPFQPLLGQDAQMAAFAAAARSDGVQVRVLAAPEIYSDGVVEDELRAKNRNRVLAHVRFGTPRLPRVLKGAVNVVVLAEDTTIPVKLGRHPFAAGAALPTCVKMVLVYDQGIQVPVRIGAGYAPCVVLPPAFVTGDLPRDAPGSPYEELRNLTLQPCTDFSIAGWQRSSAPVYCPDVLETLSRQDAVLLPWNLSAPGSLVPDVLRKVAFLARQGRFPLSLVVLPYNDVPGCMTALNEVATACAEHGGGRPDRPSILLARAGSIDEGVALLRLCRRAWIDTTDPEWRWVLYRIGIFGLLMNFISGLPYDFGAIYDAGSFAADEAVTWHSRGPCDPLFWRTRVLSLRRLGELAEAVKQGTDHPFCLQMPEAPDLIGRPKIEDLLRPTESIHYV